MGTKTCKKLENWASKLLLNRVGFYKVGITQ